jgi:hypothetical protein
LEDKKMASNVKWFKRAYRSVLLGERELWNNLRKKLPPSSVELIESTLEHLVKSEPATLPEEVSEPTLKTKPKAVTPKKASSKSKKTTKKDNEKSSK